MSARPPLPREPLEVVVDGFTHGGEGVARVEGKAVFVAGALPGERVVVRVVDDRARWARATLVQVIEPSPDRVVPPCPLAGDCGGCDLQHVAPEAQRRLLTRVVREQLVRVGGLAADHVATVVDDCRAVGPDLGYRDHAHLTAGADGRLGFHRAASHEVVPVARCPVLSDGAQRVRDAIGDASGATALTVRTDGRRGVAVVTPGSGALELPDEDAAPDVDLVLAAADGALVALRGEGTLVHDVAGLALTQPADAFFQVGRHAAAALVDEVLAAAGDVDGASVWDCYAGVGLLSLPLARAGARVVAIEADPSAAAAADANADLGALDVDVVVADVAAFLGRAAAAATGDLGPALVPPELPHQPPDVVVLDPPRAGAGPEAIAHLATLAPGRVVLVGCDVASAARDLGALVAAGWRLERVVPLHLFPMTHHVELVATLSR